MMLMQKLIGGVSFIFTEYVQWGHVDDAALVETV